MRSVLFRSERFPLGGSLSGGWAGYSYICPACGELWGRLYLGTPSEPWLVLTFPCDLHGNQFQRGGSFLKPLVWWDTASGGSLEKTLDTLSPELLRHEALMLAEQLLKA